MSQPSKTNLSCRTGFSLLELVIVLAILAAITAIAWPRVRPMLSRSSHRAAALQLKAAMAEAREQAIRSGEAWQLRAVLGTGRYLIEPARKKQDAVPSVHDASLYSELPDDVVFSKNRSSQRSYDDKSRGNSQVLSEESRSLTTAATTTAQTTTSQITTLQTQKTRLAKFFPDGRATETVIELVRPETRQRIAVRLRGLTGGITIGPTESIAESIADPAESLAEDFSPIEEPNP